ncbi:MAG: lipoprotein signal peptidase [Paludibacteraceae bacterium]|nr:lipoprotein signal peptidase [Paludibacteraceae bacterium]
MKTKKIVAALIIIGMIVIDQVVKIAVKTHMALGESFEIFPWFKILFVENPGMAFGMSIGSKWILTTFRIIVSAAVMYYLVKLIKMNSRMSYIVTISLLFTGAVGNIIDCMFYGQIFSESTYFSVASLFPAGGGYAPVMLGRVVDMLYFPLFVFPDWVPMLGGQIFFSPVFNVADICVTVSMFALILFFRNDFNDTFERVFTRKKEQNNEEA